jgi:UDP-N-acetyl-D-galactosamine dehydrogenase
LLSEVINEAQNSDFSKGYIASASLDTIKDANIYIVTVPTPIDKFNAPDLGPLLSATKMLADFKERRHRNL